MYRTQVWLEAAALSAFKSRGFGGEIGVAVDLPVHTVHRLCG